jgi:hypothetical protein
VTPETSVPRINRKTYAPVCVLASANLQVNRLNTGSADLHEKLAWTGTGRGALS